MDRISKSKRSENMRRVKSHDTDIELVLRKKLWERGIRYRKNYKNLPGKPDIVLTKYKIAVFCDSEFFHGKDFEALKKHFEGQPRGEFWIEKIGKNIERDYKVDKELEFLGYRVLHFWRKDILKAHESCVEEIERLIHETVNERTGESFLPDC